jgi:hypothetical protein
MGKAASFIRSHPYLCAFAVALAVWTIVLGVSGAVCASYQFIDDHEILRIDHDLRAGEKGFFGVAGEYLARDMEIRFRPAYILHRVAATWALGTHFAAWGFYYAALAAGTSMLFFAFLWRAGYPWVMSALFPALLLTGPQAVIYSQFGPQESTGMLFLGGALAAMAQAVTAARRRGLYEALFLACAALAALTKESFVLLLPALFSWRVWLARENGCATWGAALRRSAVAGVALGLVFAAALAVILGSVGTTRIGYAGVERLSGWAAARTVWRSFGAATWGLALFGLAGAFLASARQRGQWRGGAAEFARGAAPVVVLFLLIALPQGELYARVEETLGVRGGLFARYRLPAFLAFAFLAAWSYRWMQARHRWIGAVFLLALAAACAGQMASAYRVAREVRGSGTTTRLFLERIAAETTPETPILVAVDPARHYEYALAVRTWLELRGGRRNVSAAMVRGATYSAFEKDVAARDDLAKWYGGRVSADPRAAPPADCVAVMPELEEAFMAQRPAWLVPARFARATYGGKRGLVLYLRLKPSAPTGGDAARSGR